MVHQIVDQVGAACSRVLEREYLLKYTEWIIPSTLQLPINKLLSTIKFPHTRLPPPPQQQAKQKAERERGSRMPDNTYETKERK